MKKWILTLGIIPSLIGMSTAASAQDCGYPSGGCYPTDCGYPAGCYPSGCCNQTVFDGFYVGANVGFASFRHETVDLTGFFTFATPFTGPTWPRQHTSWAAGFQIGYDWLCCNKLFGLVWDWDWTRAETKTHTLITNTSGSTFFDNSVRSKVDWFSTIRARAGVVVCDSLFYLTAGAAVAHFKTTFRSTNPIATSSRFDDNFSNKHHRWGWTAGFGAEFALWCNWTLNAEILYLRFDTKHRTFTPSATFTALRGLNRVSFDLNDDIWVGRVGVNYRFSLCNWFW